MIYKNILQKILYLFIFNHNIVFKIYISAKNKIKLQNKYFHYFFLSYYNIHTHTLDTDFNIAKRFTSFNDCSKILKSNCSEGEEKKKIERKERKGTYGDGQDRTYITYYGMKMSTI